MISLRGTEITKKFKQQVLRGAAWATAGSVLAQITSTLTVVILGRLLAPEDFGLVAYAAVLSTFLALFPDIGINEAIVQRSELDESHLHSGFILSCCLGLVLFVSGLGCAYPLAAIIGIPEVRPIVQALSLTCIFIALQTVPIALLKRKMAFGALAGCQSVGVLIGAGVGIYMAYDGRGAWALVWQRLVASAITVAGIWMVSSYLPRLVFSWQHAKPLLTYGLNIFWMRLMGFFSKQGDQFLIGIFLGEVALGYYAIAKKLLTGIRALLLQVARQVALPALSRLQDDLPRFRRAILKGTTYLSLITFPVFFLLAVMSEETIEILLGEKWLPAATIVSILSLQGIHNSFLTLFVPAVQGIGKPAWLVLQRFINMLLDLGLFFFAYRWGIEGVALAYMLRAYCMTPLPLYILKRLTGLSPYRFIACIWMPLLIGLATAGIAYLSSNYIAGDQSSSLRLAYGVGPAVLFYVAAVVLLTPKIRQLLMSRFSRS